MGVSFVTVYKMAEPVAQQMRNCVCKTQTATTGRQPVQSHNVGSTLNQRKFNFLALILVGWLVGFGLNGPLRQYFSLYQAVSQRVGERGKKG